MNQRVYEADNYHLDADYKAIYAARKTKDKSLSLPRQQETIKNIDDPSEEDGGSAISGLESKPQQASADSSRDMAFAAAQDNNVDVLRLYTDNNGQSLSDWSFRDPKTGETLLHRALAHGSYQVVDFLLNSGRGSELACATYDENVDGQISCKTTLHQATQSGHITVIQAILAALGNRESGKSLLRKRTVYLPEGRRPRSVTCLHIAAMNGFDNIVEHFVTECGVDVDEMNERNDTALMWATLEGRRSTVELLIRLKANANAANDQGTTALYYAVRKQDSDLVQLLLKQGHANVHTQRYRGLERPLVLAAAMGTLDIVRLLLSHGADVNATVHGSETALHYAASEGHLEVCRILVERGAEIEATDSMGETALLEAARRGQLEIVDYLLSNRADACKLTVRGYSTWTYAIEATDDRMLRSLLKHTCDNFIDYCTTLKSGINSSMISLRLSHRIKLPDGFLPLHEAAKRGDRDKLKLLLSQDFSPDECDEHGNTFVHAAAASNQWKILEVTTATLRASVVNKQGRTPLHDACRLSNEKSVEALAKITQLEIKSSCGATVLHEAVRSANANDRLSAVRHIMKYIQLGRYWSLLDAQDEHGYTALHWAVKGNCKELLPELRSLKLCVADRDGNTPLHLAADLCDVETFDELLRLYPRDVKNAFQQANASSMTPLRLVIYHGSQRLIERAISAGADLAAMEPDGKTVLHWIADEIISDTSRIEMSMQTVRTIIDAAVGWFSMKKNEQMPEHPSDHYQRLKIVALINLFGNSVNKEGLTVFQYATSIGCVPLIQFISDLAYSVRKYIPDDNDWPDLSSDTVTKPSQSSFKQKVHPQKHVYISPQKTVVKPSSKRTPSETDQVTSVLELVVSNENTMSASALLDVNPFPQMAKIYWRWYHRLWMALTFYHCFTVAVLTGYGYRHVRLFNDTKVPEANDSQAICSDTLMSPVPAFIICCYAAIIMILLTSSTIIYFFDVFLGLTKGASGKPGTQKSDGSLLHRYSDIIGQIIWNSCGLIYAITTSIIVFWSYIGCRSYQDYVLSIALLFGWIYTIYYLTRLRILYQFSLMLKIVFGDFLTFFLLYMLVLMAFSFAQYVALLPVENYGDESLGQIIFVTFQWLVGMNNFWDIDRPSNDAEKSRYIFLALLYVAHMGICTIVLINMQIAAMSDSFAGIRNDSDNLWKVDSLRQSLEFYRTVVTFLCFWKVFRHLVAKFRRSHKHRQLSDEERHLRWFLRFVNASYKHTRKSKDKSHPVAGTF